MTDKFTPNDYVTVTLSAPGAEVLNEKGKYLNSRFPETPPRWRTDHKEGQELKAQFWSIMGDFKDSFFAGAKMSFTDMVLHRPQSEDATKAINADLLEALQEATARMESLGQGTSQQRAVLAKATGQDTE